MNEGKKFEGTKFEDVSFIKLTNFVTNDYEFVIHES